MMKLWCLPQYLLFLFVWFLLKAKFYAKYKGREIWVFSKEKYPSISGVALFHTLLPDTRADDADKMGGISYTDRTVDNLLRLHVGNALKRFRQIG